MNKKVNWLITDHNITVNYDGQTHIVGRTDALADRLIKALKEKRFHDIPALVSAAKRIEKFSKGNFVVRDGEIFVNGIVAPAVLGNKIVRFSNEGLPYEPLVKFAEKLQKNPSFRAVNELFQFLEKNDHPITENGNFIAYKRVRSDFLDIHSKTFDNSVGNVVEIARNMVDEDSSKTCSNGLHVANWDYAHNHYGNVDNDIMLEVEVDPADVVAVPIDYDQSKMRVCKYVVLAVVDTENSEIALRIVDPLAKPCCCCDEDEEEEDCCEFCQDTECYGECQNEDDEDEDEDEDEYPWKEELDSE